MWFGLLIVVSHVMLKNRVLILFFQGSCVCYVRTVAAVWWMPRGLAFSSEPLFLQESEIAEPKLLNKSERIQGSRSGCCPLHPPQKCTEEKLSNEYILGMCFISG